MKLYTEKEVIRAIELSDNRSIDEVLAGLTPIELPSDEEIESKYNKFIDTEIQLKFLKQEQGERLKWYYKTYFIDKIQGGTNEQQ
jgi:hypothetical protein